MDLGPLSGWAAVVVGVIAAAWALRQWREKHQEKRMAVAQAIMVATASSKTREPNSGFDADAVIVTNASTETIYGVVVGITIGDGFSSAQDIHRTFQGETPPGHQTVANLPPGKWLVDGLGGWAGMSKQPHPVISFTDSKKKHWHRDGMGHLRTVKRSAIEWHDFQVPVAYASPSRID